MSSAYGTGAITVVIPARRHVAPTVPKRPYICPANSGKLAARIERSDALPAMAEAAIGR